MPILEKVDICSFWLLLLVTKPLFAILGCVSYTFESRRHAAVTWRYVNERRLRLLGGDRKWNSTAELIGWLANDVIVWRHSSAECCCCCFRRRRRVHYTIKVLKQLKTTTTTTNTTAATILRQRRRRMPLLNSCLWWIQEVEFDDYNTTCCWRQLYGLRHYYWTTTETITTTSTTAKQVTQITWQFNARCRELPWC